MLAAQFLHLPMLMHADYVVAFAAAQPSGPETAHRRPRGQTAGLRGDERTASRRERPVRSPPNAERLRKTPERLEVRASRCTAPLDQQQAADLPNPRHTRRGSSVPVRAGVPVNSARPALIWRGPGEGRLPVRYREGVTPGTSLKVSPRELNRSPWRASGQAARPHQGRAWWRASQSPAPRNGWAWG